jgi:hypothetical protein
LRPIINTSEDMAVGLSVLTNLVNQLGTRVKEIQTQMTNGGIPHPDDIKGLMDVHDELAAAIGAMEPDPTTAAPATNGGEAS